MKGLLVECFTIFIKTGVTKTLDILSKVVCFIVQ